MNRSLDLSLVKSSSFYLLSYVGLRNEDVLLASYPRSGNTWLRFFLCNLISLNEWDGKPVDFPLLNKAMPEFGASNLIRKWTQSTIPRMVKTHKPFQALFRKNRSIGIIRDPRDVMVSYYHYKKDRHKTYSGQFSEFIRDPLQGLESWFRHYLSWRDQWTHITRYETMRENQSVEFRRILDMLDAQLPENLVNEAIKRSDARNVESADKSYKSPSIRDAKFVRSGHTKQWLNYFSALDLAYYFQLAEKYNVFVYVEDK